MPTIWVSDETFTRLQKHGTGFRGSERGTPDKALSALLDALDAPGSVHDLMARVREHPDYRFGTVFVADDVRDGAALDEQERKLCEEAATAAGFEALGALGFGAYMDTEEEL